MTGSTPKIIMFKPKTPHLSYKHVANIVLCEIYFKPNFPRMDFTDFKIMIIIRNSPTPFILFTAQASKNHFQRFLLNNDIFII